MKVLRVLVKPFIISLGCAWIALFPGCATAPKTSEPVAASPSTPTMPAPAAAVDLPAAEKAIVAPPVAPTPAAVPTPAPAPITPPPVARIAAKATIKGSQESSLLFDNFTSFIVAVDGKKIAAGRDGWDTAFEIEAGHRTLSVEFNRGVFFSRATLEFTAAPKTNYQLKFASDAELFGRNSYCNFWLVNTDTDQTVTPVIKAEVEKLPPTQGQAVLP